MTQVGRLYEEEKQEALRELERKLNNENRKKDTESEERASSYTAEIETRTA